MHLISCLTHVHCGAWHAHMHKLVLISTSRERAVQSIRMRLLLALPFFSSLQCGKQMSLLLLSAAVHAIFIKDERPTVHVPQYSVHRQNSHSTGQARQER